MIERKVLHRIKRPKSIRSLLTLRNIITIGSTILFACSGISPGGGGGGVGGGKYDAWGDPIGGPKSGWQGSSDGIIVHGKEGVYSGNSLQEMNGQPPLPNKGVVFPSGGNPGGMQDPRLLPQPAQ